MPSFRFPVLFLTAALGAEGARFAVDLRCACAVTAEGLGGATLDLQRDCGSCACHLVLCICVAVGGHNAPMRRRRLGPVVGVPAWKPYLGQPDAAAVRRNGAGGAAATPNSLFVSPAAVAHRCGAAPAVGASAAHQRRQASVVGAGARPGAPWRVGAATRAHGLGPDGWRSHGARATCPILPRPSPGQWVSEVLPAKELQQCGDVPAMVWWRTTSL